MNTAILLSFLLIGFASTAPTSKDDKIIIDNVLFLEQFEEYQGQHEIVKVFIPNNDINSIGDDDDHPELISFFVEADIVGGKKTDYGLYMHKGKTVTKLLEHGRDIAAPIYEGQTAYFAAKDGIYEYDAGNKKAVKYGNINDDLIGIVMKDSTCMYILTTDKKVYKVTEQGKKKEKLESVKDAEQLVIDLAGNLYYVDSKNKAYVVNNNGGLQEVKGMPKNFNKITLLRPPFTYEEGIPMVVDKKTYSIYPNGTIEEEEFVINTEISAYGIDPTVIHIFGKDKKLYKINLMVIVLLEELLSKNEDELEFFKSSIKEMARKNKMNDRKTKH